jgi:sigma-B regulation protein RsbU (phosphoserine phosphatase)
MDANEMEAHVASSLAQAIFEHAARTSRTASMTELIRLNADFAHQLPGADRCSLWLVDQQSNELWTILADGVEPIRIPLGQGLVGACVLQQQAILVNDTQSDPRFLGQIDARSGYVTSQVLCIPLRADGQTIGAMQLLNKPEGFNSRDADFVGLLAHFAATAIQGERLRQEAESARLLNHELSLARDVQARMLPQEIPVIEGLEIGAYCRPALQVGGDYYDLLPLDDGRFAFTLGDVSGKGIAAAVIMASVQTLLRSFLQRSSRSLATIIADVSQALYQSSSSNRFSTLFCGIVDLRSGLLTYVNAGQQNPLLLRQGQQPFELPGTGIPLGILSDATFVERSFQLEAGDLLLTFSDGIQEVANPDGEFWEDARPAQILEAHANTAASDLPTIFANQADLWASGAKQHDDMTIVALRFVSRRREGSNHE